MPTDREQRRIERQRKLEEISSSMKEYKDNQPNLWEKSRDYVAMATRGASGVASSMGTHIGAGIAGAGEIAAQTIEKRDKYNWPQVGLQSGLGAVPGSAIFKGLTKGANLARGAFFGGAGAAATQQFEGPHIPTKEDVLGIGLGLGLGSAGGAIAGRFRSQGGRTFGQAADDVAIPPPASASAPAVSPLDINPSAARRLDPGEMDAVRRSTLEGVRGYRRDPRSVTPRQTQAIADNLESRLGTPEALESAAEMRRGLPLRDLTRQEGVLQGRATDPIGRRSGPTDLPNRPPPDVTLADSRQLRRANLQPRIEDVKPLTPEVKFGSQRQGARGKRGRKDKRKRQQPVKPVDEFPPASRSIDNIEDIEEVASTPGAVYAKTSDTDLKFLAKQGDSEAITELGRRKRPAGESGVYLGSGLGAVEPYLRRGAQTVSRHFGARKPSPQVPLTENAPIASRMLKRADKRSPGFLRSYQTWIGSRSASKVEGILKRREFTGLDPEGLEGIKKFQHGLRSGQFQDVQNYFNTKHVEIEQAGVKLGFKENYLPQLWDNTVEEIQEGARRLGLKPRFSMQSVLENYEKGLEIGLKPRFTKISDLVGWYEQTANKAIADRQFFNWISEKGLIQPGSKTPRNGTWSPLNAEHFPVQKFIGKSKEYTQDLWAPKDIAGIINNYLEPPHGQILAKAGDLSATTKNFALSGGVPGTAINFHGYNITYRNTLARGLFRGSSEAAKWIPNPQAALKDLEANLHKAPFFIKHGFKLSTEGFEFGESSAQTLTSRLDPTQFPIASKILNPLTSVQEKVLKIHGKYFEKGIFQEVLPALKLRHVNEFYGELRKRGMSESAAARSASEATNNLYGGINWEGMGRSRDFQNLLRTVILAPDWFESNYRIAQTLVKGMKNPNTPHGKMLQTVMKNLAATYMAANVANYTMSGKMMWDNDPGHLFDIDLGQTNKTLSALNPLIKVENKRMYFRPFGTAADFARIPFEAVLSTFKKDLGQGFQILRNRLALPASATTNLLTQRNRFGRKIFGRDDFGRDIPVGKQILGGLSEVAGVVTPPYVSNPVRYGLGEIGPVEALTGGIESPVRFSSRGGGGTRRRERTSRKRKSR